MLCIAIYLPFLLGCILAKEDCIFKPRTDISCLGYLLPSEREHGCLRPNKELQFAGSLQEINGEMYINVHSGELDITKPVWVRQRDGTCTNDCCDKRTRKARFIFPVNLLSGDLECLSILNPCKHGMCHYSSSTKFSCTCSEGYEGRHCDKAIINCKSEPCLHNGTCWKSISGVTCICSTGYTGSRCETDYAEMKLKTVPVTQTVTPIPVHVPSTTLQPSRVTPTVTTTSIHIPSTTLQPSVVTSIQNITPIPVHVPSTTLQPSAVTSIQSIIPVHVPSTTRRTHTVTQTSTPLAFTSNTCEDSALVKCEDSNVCSSSLITFCPVTCRLCTPTTTTTVLPCVNNPYVKCSSPNICSSPLGSQCPVTCGKCGKTRTATTTTSPCVNDPMVKCSIPGVCTTAVATMCPVTCGKCGH